MAFPTAVNDQITDAVTQSNLSVLGDAPAMSLANLYLATTHSTALAYENAVAGQSQQYVLGLAAATRSVMQLFAPSSVPPDVVP